MSEEEKHGPDLDADEALAEHRRRVVAASKVGTAEYAEALRDLADEDSITHRAHDTVPLDEALRELGLDEIAENVAERHAGLLRRLGEG